MAGSILVTHGVHARLENIDADGRWLADEEFWHGGKKTVRKAGESARGAMAGWVKHRASHPELFSQIRVWQQPCAVVDQIVWRWQLELDAAEHKQAVRVTDCLGAVWSQGSKEAAFLLQQLQAPVAPGCTPLAQPTDTHLAKVAKDAGRKKKDELRTLLRLAALKLGKQPEYHSSLRELMLVCQAMHDGMVQLNVKSEVVLQAARSCGWLSYRPSAKTERLERADTQLWAQVHEEKAGRLTDTHLTKRYAWLDEAGKPIQDATWVAECEVQAESRRPDLSAENCDESEDICLDSVRLFENAADYQQALAALTHPSARQDAETEKEGGAAWLVPERAG